MNMMSLLSQCLHCEISCICQCDVATAVDFFGCSAVIALYCIRKVAANIREFEVTDRQLAVDRF